MTIKMASHGNLEDHLSENLGRPMNLHWEFLHDQTLAFSSLRKNKKKNKKLDRGKSSGQGRKAREKERHSRKKREGRENEGEVARESDEGRANRSKPKPYLFRSEVPVHATSK